jgi:hypothetical protein
LSRLTAAVATNQDPPQDGYVANSKLKSRGRQQRLHDPDFNHGRLSSTREAFQRFRKHRLDAQYDSTYVNVNLGVCLDECLSDSSSGGCVSVIYSEGSRECRLSRFDQDEKRLMYDEEFDYFESLRGKIL